MKYIYLIIEESGLIKDGNYYKCIKGAFSSLAKAVTDLNCIASSYKGRFFKIGSKGLFSYVTYSDEAGTLHYCTIEREPIF